jgi:hypothetical protein
MALMRVSTGHLLAAAMFIAVVCNGAGFFAKRIGVIEHEAYLQYWTFHCAGVTGAGEHEWQCETFTDAAAIERHRLTVNRTPKAEAFKYLYRLSPGERLLKALKDLFFLGLIGACCWALSTPAQWRELERRGLPPLAFGGYAAAAFMASLALNGIWVAAAGARAMLFMPVALLGRWAASRLHPFATATAILIVLQAVSAPLESVLGMHIFREWTPWALASRVTGTLVQPNSMGVFCAVGWAFCLCFGGFGRRTLGALGLIAVAVIFLSGSGTGLVCALVLASMHGRAPAQSLRSLLPTIVAVLVLLLLLPTLPARWDILHSVADDRLKMLHLALWERPAWQVWLGGGLGVHTNLALLLAGGGAVAAGSSTDSALIGLLFQVGVAGTALFYGMLAWAGARDPQARPFYVAVALCTLTMNVAELFPVNALLGLALSHAIWAPARAGPSS